MEECNFTFFTADTKLTNINAFAAFFHISHYYDDYRVGYMGKKNTLNISLEDFPQYNSVAAIQGIVLFDNYTNSCPMESVSKDTPFLLNDETQIFFIQSSFYENKSRLFPCKWSFLAPDGYGFKVVVLQLNISDSTKLIVKNSTDIFFNHRGIKLNTPYYNSDTYLEINLSEGIPVFVTDMEFKAYISIVRKNVQKMFGNCTTKSHSYGVEWSLYFEDSIDNEYSDVISYNNIYCSYTLIMPAGKTYFASVDKLCVETNSDYIKYYYDDENGKLLTTPLTTLMFDPLSNGSDRYVKFEFISDGSLPSLGFFIAFRELDCRCNNPLMYCNKTYGIMPYKGFDPGSYFGFYYCDYLICSFTIIGCTSNLTLLLLDFEGPIYLDDKIRIFSQGEIVREITNLTRNEDVKIYLNSNNLNILQIETYRSVMARKLQIFVKPFEAPKVDEYVTLSRTNYVHLLDTGKTKFAVITVPDNLRQHNYTLTVFSNIAYGLFVFNNESLTISLLGTKCFREPNVYTCDIIGNQLAVFEINDSEIDPFLAIKLNAPSKECIMKQNVFFAKKDDRNYNITAMATADAECTVYILIDDTLNDYEVCFYISHLWTTSKVDTVKMFVGVDQTRLFFEYNSKSAKRWQNILLNSKVYSVIIPPKAAIYISLTSYISYYPVPFFLDFPHKSIVATPFYGTSKKNYPHTGEYFASYNLSNSAAKFTILYYKNFSGSELFFSTNNADLIDVNTAGDVLKFGFGNVYIEWLDASVQEGADYGAIILIETIE